MLNTRILPSQRFRVKLFTGGTVEGDVNTWLGTNPGALVQIYLAHDGANPVVLALYRTSQ
ncbi:MAG: hypothetical protein HY680_05650 [Chloroflexi bacterium]|nr:hypothetical protein [Chloroflexota bacterium]